MEQYTVIARRYRPQTFEEVVGQEAIATTLQNAVREQRVAHAFLFAGSRGVGKTSMARIFAKALNCAKGPTPEPCEQCPACQSIADCSDPDVIEIDAASNTGVDNVRELRENIRYAPLRGRYKVYIVDEAHMLSKSAWNAFLKTLEEPPPHGKFVFATTEAYKVPDTIRSRCQQFEFRRITTHDIAARLKQVSKKEKVKCDDALLNAIARAGQGSMRDAQSLLDQLISFSNGAPTLDLLWEVLGSVPQSRILELAESMVKADYQTLVLAADELLARGREPGVFLDQMVDTFRQLLLLHTCGPELPLLEIDAEERPRAVALADAFGVDGLTAAIQLLGESRRRLRDVTNPRVLLELTLIKLCRVRDLLDVGGLIDRLERIAQDESSTRASALPATPVAASVPVPRAAAPASAPRPQPPAAPAAPPAAHAAPPSARVAPAPAPAPAPTRGRTPPAAASTRPAPPPAKSGTPPAAAQRVPPPAPADAEDAPDPVPPASFGEFTLESVRAAWGRILEEVRKKNMIIGAYVREAQPLKVDGRELTLGFSSGFVFHKDNLERAESRAVVESVLEALTGDRVHLNVRLTTAGEAATLPSTPEPGAPGAPNGPRNDAPPDTAASSSTRGGRTQEAMRDPVVRKTQDLFDARIMNVEE